MRNSVGCICVLTGFSGSAINANIYYTGQLFVKDTQVRQSGNGLYFSKYGDMSSTATIDNSRFENNVTGVNVDDSGRVVVRNSVIARNSGSGVSVGGVGTGDAIVLLENSMINANPTGIWSCPCGPTGGRVRLSNTTLAFNDTALSGPNIVSYGNNQMSDNTTNGAIASTQARQ